MQADNTNFFSDLGIIKTIFSFMRKYWLIYTLGILLFFSVGAIGSINNGMMLRSLTEANIAGDMSIFFNSLWLYLGFLLFTIVGTTLQVIFYNYSKACMEVDLKSKMILKTMRMKMELLNRTDPGEFISRFNSDAQTTLDIVGNGLIHMMAAFTGGISMVLVVGVWCWQIAAYSLLIGIFNILISSILAKKQRRVSEGYQKSLAQVVGRLNEFLLGSAVIRVFNLRGAVLKRLEQDAEYASKMIFDMRVMDSVSGLVTGLINMLGFAGTFIFGILLYRNGYAALPDIMGSVMLANGISSSFAAGAFKIIQYQKCLAAGKRVIEMLNAEEENESFGSDTVDSTIAPVLEMRNLVCQYKGRDPVLENINMTVMHNQFVGLVGLSGGGKSTLLKAIMQFVDYEGEMNIFGKPARRYSLESLRFNIAYVAQENVLFDDTIGVNIGYGRPGANQGEIEWAARMSNSYEFIKELPDGFDTRVGERGIQLSGGQRQRIAIARAFLMDAPLLLLDEATSALDSQSEAQVQAALDKLMQGRTILSVAHRLSTIQSADVILVFDHGTIVERGTHQQLLDAKGYYADLYIAQTKSA